MTWRTHLETETNWMEYVQFMGPILSMTIGPTAFSHKILSERSQREVRHVSRIKIDYQKYAWNTKIDIKNQKSAKNMQKGKTLRLYSENSLIVWRE